MLIKVARYAEVPEGDYCECGNERCSSLQSDTQKVGWEDGLGSPGTITHYYCAVFDISLSRTILENQDTPTGRRQVIIKDRLCKEACAKTDAD